MFQGILLNHVESEPTTTTACSAFWSVRRVFHSTVRSEVRALPYGPFLFLGLGLMLDLGLGLNFNPEVVARSVYFAKGSDKTCFFLY